MAPTFRLSPESLQMIENICNGFRRFENYHIVTTDDNWSTGTFHVDVYHMGRFCSKYMFCPTLNGKIGSIAIYGVGLPDHLKKIQASMNCFGLSVASEFQVPSAASSNKDFVPDLMHPQY